MSCIFFDVVVYILGIVVYVFDIVENKLHKHLMAVSWETFCRSCCYIIECMTICQTVDC